MKGRKVSNGTGAPIQSCYHDYDSPDCRTVSGFQSSSGLIKDLNAELNLLDEAVAEWQQRLALSQEQQEGDMYGRTLVAAVRVYNAMY